MKLPLPVAVFSLSGLSIISGQTTTPVVSPKIVASSPTAWQTAVNPSQKEISVTFDQVMSPAFTAWIGRSSVVQEVDSNSSISTDRRTFRCKAQIEAGRVYVFGINEKRIPSVGFQNQKGLSAPPYFLVFQTAGTLKPDDIPPRAASTNPPNGMQRVDSTRVKAVVIAFDRSMQTGKHGLQMRENQKEVDLSKARFQYNTDGKTFTLAYDFKPGSSYEFELNSVHDIGFASAKRIPLWPVKFAFSTQ